ncbi:MAG: YncE family protein [Polyangiaceae bacterium]
MRVTAIATLGLVLTTCVTVSFVACSGSNAAPPPEGADSGTPSGEDATAPANDSAPGADASEDAPPDAAPLDSSAPDALVGPFIAVSTISLAGSPSAMAFNAATNTLYVAFTGTTSAANGIAVIDGATNTIATTIPYPGDAAAPYPIVQMAVDVALNTLYAADSNPGGQTLYVISGATNTVVTTIPIVDDLAMQVDSTAHKVYVLGSGTPAVPDGGSNAVTPPTIAIVDGTTNTAGAPVVVGDQAVAAGSGIAFDPIASRLYVCGPNAADYSNGTINVAAIDALDTTTNLAPVGAQLSFAGEVPIACVAGWGGGAVVTSSAPAIDFTGPVTIALPTGFAATAATGSGSVAPIKAQIVVFGSSSGSLEVAAVVEDTDTATSINLPPTAVLPGATAWRAIALASASGSVVQAYVTYATTADAGATPSVTYASIQAQ